MTTNRIPCFGTLHGGSTLDAPTFDRLHSYSALLAADAAEIDGIGGTERADDDKLAELLVHAQQIVGLAKDALDLAVDAARDHGWTWDQVGNVVGTTRQAAQMRFGK